MVSFLILLLFLVGLITALVDLGRSQFRSVLAWGLLAVSAGLLLSRLT